MEMEERLKGTWEITKEDEDLQGRFWKILELENIKSYDLRVGAAFLRQNKHLLN